VGIYYYLVVVFGWFDIFTNFGLDLYLIREVSRNRDEAGRYFYNTTLLRLAMAVIGVGLVALFIIGRQATVNPPLPDYALLTLALLYAGLFPATLSKGMTSLYYAFEQAEKPAAIATITSINKAVFGVLALMLGFGIVGLASVSIINNLITFGVLLWAGRDLIGRIATWRPDWPLLRTMRIEGLPLLLNHFLQTIFFQIDIIILEAMKGAVIVAQYSIAYKWVLAINIIPSFFTQALLPVMSRQAQEDKGALWRTYRFGIKLLLSLALPIAVGFTVLAEPLTYIMGGQQYLPAGAIAIQLMIWSIPIGWMNSLTQYVLVALDMQRMITRAFIAAVAFNIISNVIFIPQFSYQAAAITTIFSELALFIPFAILTARGMGQSIGWMSLLWRPVLATGAMLAVVILGAPLPMLLVLAVASVVYGVVLLALKPFSPEEISMMPQRVVQSRVGRLVLGG
jgi:O-antigen/teichoic acid export membrane protein